MENIVIWWFTDLKTAGFARGNFMYFWCQPTHAARAETACGLCRARRRKTSVAKLKAPKPSACRFWCQKYNKSPKPANKRSGIDNQAVFRFGSPCRSFRMGSRRHRRTRVRFPKHYLVRECFSFPKTVIYRLLHFHSSWSETLLKLVLYPSKSRVYAQHVQGSVLP